MAISMRQYKSANHFQENRQGKLGKAERPGTPEEMSRMYGGQLLKRMQPTANKSKICSPLLGQRQ